MEHTRRDVLGLAGVSLSALAAGCLSGPDGTGTPTATATATPTSSDTARPTAAETPTAALPSEFARVDEPPYQIDQPECDYPEATRDPLYLCANMPTEPSLSFGQAASRGNILAESGLTFSDGHEAEELYATLLTDDARVADDDASDPAQLIRATDFGSHAVLVVQTGWGSGSVSPHVERVETTANGVHAFGCHSDPCVQTNDETVRTAAVRFERPDTLDGAVVSLTVAPDERWNVAAGAGVVTIPES